MCAFYVEYYFVAFVELCNRLIELQAVPFDKTRANYIISKMID